VIPDWWTIAHRRPFGVDLIERFPERTRLSKGGEMANVYVEARPKGRTEGEPITDYVLEDHADHPLGTFRTQAEAIAWAKREGHHPLVARSPAPQRQEETRPLARSLNAPA
jgi:hypothetical protein